LKTTSSRKRRQARPYQREVDLSLPPRLQLDFYDNCVILTRRRVNRWTSYPVSPAALASVLGNMPASSGLLPPNTLATGLRSGQAFYVVYIPAQHIRIQVEDGGELALWTIPTPPLVWAGCGATYRIWALGSHSYPTSHQSDLFHAPFPNVHGNGDICWGTTDARAQATPATLMKTLNLFLTGSRFNQHLVSQKSRSASGNILGMLSQLDGVTEYPLDDLVRASKSLGDVLRGDL
jgi:PRTRC genetic system protein B